MPEENNDWKEFYEANREHIEGMMDRFSSKSDKVRAMSNKHLAKGMYRMILSGQTDDLLLAEAAERLAVIETTNMNEARKN